MPTVSEGNFARNSTERRKYNKARKIITAYESPTDPIRMPRLNHPTIPLRMNPKPRQRASDSVTFGSQANKELLPMIHGKPRRHILTYTYRRIHVHFLSGHTGFPLQNTNNKAIFDKFSFLLRIPPNINIVRTNTDIPSHGLPPKGHHTPDGQAVGHHCPGPSPRGLSCLLELHGLHAPVVLPGRFTRSDRAFLPLIHPPESQSAFC